MKTLLRLNKSRNAYPSCKIYEKELAPVVVCMVLNEMLSSWGMGGGGVRAKLGRIEKIRKNTL